MLSCMCLLHMYALVLGDTIDTIDSIDIQRVSICRGRLLPVSPIIIQYIQKISLGMYYNVHVVKA